MPDSYPFDVSGELTLSGTCIKDWAGEVSGEFTSSGALAKDGGKSLSGVISISGTLARGIGKGISGALSFIGRASGTNTVDTLRKILGVPKPTGQILSGKRE